MATKRSQSSLLSFFSSSSKKSKTGETDQASACVNDSEQSGGGIHSGGGIPVNATQDTASFDNTTGGGTKHTVIAVQSDYISKCNPSSGDGHSLTENQESASTYAQSICTDKSPSVRSHSAVQDFEKMMTTINSLFDEETIVHSHYHCAQQPCSLSVSKGKRNFKHNWCSNKDLTYDCTTGIWWLLYVEGEGMYCCICRQHDATNEQNKQKVFGKDPAIRFQMDAVRDHGSKSNKHKAAVESEMLRRVSVFQKILDEKQTYEDEVLHSAFTALYWLIQVGMAYRNYPSLLEMVRLIGLEKMKHFQHKSLWSTRGMVMTMGQVIKENLLKAAKQASCYGLMVDDVTDIAVMEQNIIFIQFFNQASQKVEIGFLAVNNLLEESTNANANAITKCILDELQQCKLSTEKFTSLASDGASVMVGRLTGVATQLKEVNQKLINVHCICHRLALACGDSNDDVKYVNDVERILVQLWKFLEYSCVKTAAFLKVQLSLLGMDLPEDEKNRQHVAHKLEKACRTRWLSMDEAVQGIWHDYVAILLTLSLEQFKKDATGCGLLHKMKDVKFLGMIYILKEVLPILAMVSKCFQKNVVSFAKISPTLQMAKDSLEEILNQQTPIKALCKDLKDGGRLQPVLHDLRPHGQPDCELPTPTQMNTLEHLLQKYVKALKVNIDRRFSENSTSILAAFSIFDILAVPEKEETGFREHGNNSVARLGAHYFTSDVQQEQLNVEWAKAKYDMLSWKEQLPEDIKRGKGSITSTEWSLKQFLHPTYVYHYPLLAYIAEVCISTPVSNAWPERGASVLKGQKTRLRSKLKNDLLGNMLQISINGPKVGPQIDALINKCVRSWLVEKKRRKLPKQSKANVEVTPDTQDTSCSDGAASNNEEGQKHLQDIVKALKLTESDSDGTDCESESEF